MGLAALACRARLRWLLWLAFALLVAAGPLRPAAQRGRGDLVVTALDVGQGSAILVRGPDGGFLLVDGGGSPGSEYPVGERVVVPALRDLGVSRLDAVALTHPDADHGEGLAAVLDAFPVERLIIAGTDCPHPLARGLAARAARRGVPTEGWTAGRREPWRGALLEILGPARGSPCGENDASLVLRIVSRGGALLLPGDLEAAGEAALLDRAPSLRARVLIVPHHGSRGSTTPAFLEAVAPEIAVIQAGRQNRFGHPAPRVLRDLRRQGSRVWRTDLQGAVRLRLAPEGTLSVEALSR
jgi:competence protein ComEC